MATASNYVAISRRTLDMEDYIDVARRHVGWIIGPTFAGLVIASVVALVMQNVYISEAVMRITPSQISSNIVASTVNQHLTERIQQMQQEILSRTSLSAIITDPRLDLYKVERSKEPMEDVIEQMKKDIGIHILELPGTTSDRAASAFQIQFSYPDPHKAQQVVQTLVTKFNDANVTTQHTQQQMVTSFVHDELTTARANLTALDAELTKFRIENTGKLPEESSMNIAQLTSLQQQAATINDYLNREAQEKVQLDTHLETLQGQLELLGMFDKEADVTGPVARQNERLLLLNRQVTDTEANVAQLRQIYKPNYPDVRDAEKHLAELKRERDELQKKQDAEEAKPKEPVKKKTNYAQAQSASAIQAQIDASKASEQSLEMERRNKMQEQQRINQKINEYQARLQETSAIEAKYQDLLRNEKTATETLQTEQAKESLAAQNGKLQEVGGGERLEVLDTPSLPLKPSAPKRYQVIGVGVALAFVVGLALAGVQEARDTSLKNLKDVRAYTNLPVLSSIPLLENTMLVRRKRRLAYLAWSAAVIIGLLAIGAAAYYHATVLA
ncbi:MAG TPA: hypothetical protein VG273_23990 [Bryobacteraceae bacterium]|jgi:uncharacterized protein involved in exopolysaccharide biosynthesis|nr:hypothetical protein [Bryobacteraceae bacterium]